MRREIISGRRMRFNLLFVNLLYFIYNNNIISIHRNTVYSTVYTAKCLQYMNERLFLVLHHLIK